MSKIKLLLSYLSDLNDAATLAALLGSIVLHGAGPLLFILIFLFGGWWWFKHCLSQL